MSELHITERILALLKERNLDFRIVEHEPTKSSAESAKVRGTPLSSGAKALLTVREDGNPVLAVLPADQRLDLKKLAAAVDASVVRMASSTELEAITGLQKGAVPPLGRLMEIETVFDTAWAYAQEAAFNCGSRSLSIVMRSEDLIEVEKPKMEDISE